LTRQPGAAGPNLPRGSSLISCEQAFHRGVTLDCSIARDAQQVQLDQLCAQIAEFRGELALRAGGAHSASTTNAIA
jgi:hypothetical protein